GSSGDDTFVYLPGAAGHVTIQSSSGADVLDLSRAPLVSYTLTGDPTLGTLTVQGEVATTVSLTSDHPAGSTYGQAVTFTATVSPGATGVTPTGSVQFQVDGVNLGQAVTLVNGTASVATSALPAGTHSLTAAYTSDASNVGDSSTTSPVAQV